MFDQNDRVIFVDTIEDEFYPVFTVVKSTLQTGYYQHFGYWYNPVSMRLIYEDEAARAQVKGFSIVNKKTHGPIEWSYWSSAKLVAMPKKTIRNSKYLQEEFELELEEIETKEFCPKCLSTNIEWVNMATKCKDCWFTW
jgi:hypothetical protein